MKGYVLASGLIYILAAVSAGAIDRARRLQERVAELERPVSKPRPMALLPEPETVPLPAEAVGPEPEALPAPAPAPEPPPIFEIITNIALPKPWANIPGLNEGQKAWIEGLWEKRTSDLRKEDGEAQARRLAIEALYDWSVRQVLFPDQQEAFEKIRRMEWTGADAPVPDRLLAAQPIGSYVAEEPGTAEFDVAWGGRWWPARMVELRDNLVRIHYVGWVDGYDEWVIFDRIRPLLAPAPAPQRP